MLRTLYIRDYALIEELELSFSSGLNIITGETGAGKSILVGALKMILGERASSELIRSEASKAVIEGVFDGDAESVTHLLEEAGIDTGSILILRREITASYSRGFINDSPATLQLMRQIAEQVIDLHGQHEHQSLLRTDTHISLLDQFGGLSGLLQTYREEYETVARLRKERSDLVAKELDLLREKDLIAFQMQEIDRVGPKADEEEELEAERRVLENAEQLFESTSTLYEVLYNAEDSVFDRLVVARNELRDLAEIDPRFEEYLQEVKTAEISIAEVTGFLQEYNASIAFDQGRLETIRDRMGELSFLARKYGGSIESVLERRAEIGRLFELASDFKGSISRLDHAVKEATGRLTKAALLLSGKRKEVAGDIERAILAELEHLGIANAIFQVHFELRPDFDGWIMLPVESGDVEPYAVTQEGLDKVEFYISTNLGEEPKPLAKVASGGEISRIMLALKSILAKSERLPILVFDEIDVGISGRIAGQVGESLARLGQYHQIIAITHLPQIAARADQHFVVQKAEAAGRTRTMVTVLNPDQQIEEVATLISGSEITDEARANAKKLLGMKSRT